MSVDVIIITEAWAIGWKFLLLLLSFVLLDAICVVFVGVLVSGGFLDVIRETSVLLEGFVGVFLTNVSFVRFIRFIDLVAERFSFTMPDREVSRCLVVSIVFCARR